MTTAQTALEAVNTVEYVVSEVFDTLQGEGHWAGAPMRFIRLAGCNVGKPRNAETDKTLRFAGTPLNVLASNPNHTCCTIFDGAVMLCDTDYRAHHKATVRELLNGLGPESRICITGGEPFIHDLSPLVFAAQRGDIAVHIETSGTRLFNLSPLINPMFVWITCSPKHGFVWDTAQLAAISEVKLLVHPFTSPKELLDFYYKFQAENIHTPHDVQFFLSPVTPVPDQPAHDNLVHLCIDICKRYPTIFRLSCQLHKYWRIG